jgi:DMSO/TMAO reductase YedYZ molybdopterin-dependent catalytic subunit
MFKMVIVIGVVLLALGIVACGDETSTAETTAPAAAGSGADTQTPATSATTGAAATTVTTGGAPTTVTTLAADDLEPITVPTLPAEIPGYLEVDPATGLHMTGTPTVVDFENYRLKVSGLVATELSLTYDDLRRLPKMTASPALECKGFFVDHATWSGASLATILEMAGLQPGAERIKMTSADGYSTALALETARAPENFLAHELMGRPLPVLHGFPVRAIFPGQNGNFWVKWLTEITVE